MDLIGISSRRLTERPPQARSQIHWRLYWNTGLGLVLHTEKQSLALDEKVLCFIPPLLKVRQELTQEVDHLAIHVLLGGICDHFHHEILSLPLTPDLQQELRELMSLAKQNQPKAWLIVHVGRIVYTLLSHLPPSTWDVCLYDARLEKIISLMESDSCRKHSNAELAKYAGMGESTFIRHFSRQVGTTPQDYLQSLRLKRTAHELAYTQMPIEEIADQWGFCDRSYFSKRFQNKYGCSPSAYRKKFFFMH